jgi:hypothetical protein
MAKEITGKNAACRGRYCVHFLLGICTPYSLRGIMAWRNHHSTYTVKKVRGFPVTYQTPPGLE